MAVTERLVVLSVKDISSTLWYEIKKDAHFARRITQISSASLGIHDSGERDNTAPIVRAQ